MSPRAAELVAVIVPVLVEAIVVTFAIGVAAVWAGVLTGAI